MSELTKRLRQVTAVWIQEPGGRVEKRDPVVMQEAADRIEALEAGLDRASVLLESEGNYVEAQAARALLEKR